VKVNEEREEKIGPEVIRQYHVNGGIRIVHISAPRRAYGIETDAYGLPYAVSFITVGVGLKVGEYSDMCEGTVTAIDFGDDGVIVVHVSDSVIVSSHQDAPVYTSGTATTAPIYTSGTATAAPTYTSAGMSSHTVYGCYAVQPDVPSVPCALPLSGQKVVIGMIGKAGSGKDTVADYLVRMHCFKKIALADPLKKAVQAVFDVDDDIMYDRVKREEPLANWPEWSVRKLLQFVGTEMFRNMVDQDVWVKNCASRAVRQDFTVVSDVRFHNEVGGLRQKIGDGRRVFFIKVERPDVGGGGAPSGIANHASESAVDELEYDYRIINDGSLDDLYAKVEGVIAMISGRLASGI